MKKHVEIVEVEKEGLLALLGEEVTIWCCRYTYSGKLIGVNDTDILLEDAYMVFNTGKVSTPGFSDAESLGGNHYIRTAAIESYRKKLA